MEHPDMNAKSAKLRNQFLDPDGKIVNCSVGNKPFIQTKLTLSAEPSTQNFHLLVKSKVYEELEAEISITSNTALSTEFNTHTGFHVFHDTSKPPPALGSFPGPRRFPPPTPNPTVQPKDPRTSPKMCNHCDMIAMKKMKDVLGQPFSKEFHYRQKNRKHEKFSHPENCSQFMSLSMNDRALVLSEQNFCPHCAGKHDANTACSLHWVSVKRPPSVRCRHRDKNSNEQCSYHVVLCPNHAASNHKELKNIADRLGIPRYPVPDHVAMTIQTVEELNVDPGVTIERPQPKKYTPFDICYKTTHEEETVQTVLPASRKLPFIYTVKTNNNEMIQVMADPGATLSILSATETVPSATGAKHGDPIFGTVSKWFNKKRGKSNKQSNRSEKSVSKDNDQLGSDEQTEQHFLTVTSPRMGTP